MKEYMTRATPPCGIPEGARMHFDTIETEEREDVFVITLNQPEKRNALSSKMWEELCCALEYFEHHDALRAAVLTNAGSCFCAGANLKELAAGTWHAPAGKEDWGFAGMTKHYFDKPLIAAVRGKALGGGTEITLACDLAVASEDAVFGLPEPRRGLTAAGGGGMTRIAQQIPFKFALELVLTAEPIDAQKALSWGLVNYVVPDDCVLDKAVELARSIAKGAPLAIKYSKRTMYECAETSILYPSEGWDILENYEAITCESADAHEGEVAFIEKRDPVWKGC